MQHSEINGSECHMLNTKADRCITYGEIISWFMQQCFVNCTGQVQH